jgi:myosin heavy subunit
LALIRKKSYGFSATLFGINHFAGEVDYDASEFVEKNQDTLSEDILLVASKSTNDIVSSFSDSYQKATKRKGNLVGTSLWTKFGRQMKDLFKELEGTRTTYVQCIIPNSLQEPKKLDNLCVINQFRSIGLLTALQISNTYTDKHNYDDIMQRFWPVISRRPDCRRLWKKYKDSSEDESNYARADFESMFFSILGDNKSFSVGSTQIYFRSGGLEVLEGALTKTYKLSAARIQGLARGYITRMRLKEEKIRNSSGVRSTWQRMLSPIRALHLSICRIFKDLLRPSPPMISQ